MAKVIAPSTSAGPNRVTPEFTTKDNGYSDPWIDATPQFIYTCHPARWRVIDGRLVPLLGKQVLVDGVNNIEMDARGRVRFGACKNKMEDEGWLFIPYEWGPGGDSYLQAVETRPGGSRDLRTAYISVWESAYAGDTTTYGDLTAYVDWLSGVVKAGKIPPCPPQVARRMLEKAEERLSEANALFVKHGDAASQTRAAAYAVEVKALKAAAGSKPRGRKAKPVAIAPASLED